MFHSMYIGDKNTWDDYSLVPVSKIYFPNPSQKVQTLDIEGASGSLDFSTLLTGYPIYGDRVGQADFYLLDAIDTKVYTNSQHAFPANYNFYDIFSKIRGDLDGKTARIWLEDDPDWYYEGRVNITDSMESPRPRIIIKYNVGPYKKARRATRWTLNGLGTIVNRQIISAELAGPMPANFTMQVTGGQASVRFICEALNIDQTKTLEIGTYTLYEWVIYGASTIEVTAATGTTVSVTYTPGRL